MYNVQLSDYFLPISGYTGSSWQQCLHHNNLHNHYQTITHISEHVLWYAMLGYEYLFALTWPNFKLVFLCVLTAFLKQKSQRKLLFSHNCSSQSISYWPNIVPSGNISSNMATNTTQQQDCQLNRDSFSTICWQIICE